MTVRTIFHVDMDAFFAAIEQRDDPALKGRPVIVGADPKAGRGRGVVSTCSYEARKFGVHSAQPISKAFQLCPKGIFLPVNFSKYRAASKIIHKIFYDFTPDVEPVSIDEAFLDMTGSYHFYQTPLNAGKELKKKIWDAVQLNASVGIAPVKLVAKLASDFCKPNGLLEVPEDKVMSFLKPLAVEKLWGVGPKTKQVLNKLNIRTIGDLQNLSNEHLVQCFGEQGQHFYELSRGIDLRNVETSDEAKSISHEYTFEEDSNNVEKIYAILLDLSEQVSRRLRKSNLKAKTISIKVRLKGFQTYTRARTLLVETNLTDIIYQNAKDLFLKFHKPGDFIRLIGVKASHWNEDPYVQDSLFKDERKEKSEKIHRALDSIKDRFGEDSIHRGS